MNAITLHDLLDKLKENSLGTMEIFVHPAYYLGVYRIKSELEDFSLQYLKPDMYKKIEEWKLRLEESNNDSLKESQFKEELCFSHGDLSLPNIFALNDEFSSFIDVGESGIADKCFDFAICEKSIKRNFGEECISKFYEELNIVSDREEIDYYLLMMELYL